MPNEEKQDNYIFPNQWGKFPPIEEHGLIGNMHTAALISTDACVDWYCYPHFDSPSIFASLLDCENGGFFRISVGIEQEEFHRVKEFHAPHVRHKQVYVPDSNVLISRFFTHTGVGHVTDFMPVKKAIFSNRASLDQFAHHEQWSWLVRELETVRGKLFFKVECCPKFNYGRDQHDLELLSYGARFKSKSLNMVLTSTRKLEWKRHPKYDDGVQAELTLLQGEREVITLRESYFGKPDDPFKDSQGLHPDITGHPVSLEQSDLLKNLTLSYWRNWISKCSYKGRWREIVNRSALTLKLLTFEPSGAIIASPTTSLPEGIGSGRNWDYRFSWIRDSSFALYAFMTLGFREEADAFIKWVEHRCNAITDGSGKLKIMYGIRGEESLDEIVLPHLSGYMKSGPVRIGNGAFDQLQLDICGELMDTIFMADEYSYPISYELWKHCRNIVNWVIKNWKEKDEGIWEVRGGKQHFVYSKIMCWVALDRAIRIAEKRSFPCNIFEWRSARDALYEEIQERGFNKTKKAFVQAYDSDCLDASVLMIPLVAFMSPMDPRTISTIDAILRNIEDGGLLSNNLVYRYDLRSTNDGLSGEEGTFSICTFWLVEALARIGKYEPKYLEKARWIMEQMLGYANHLGLYSEEIGVCGEALGNFPQAFTHLALIRSAVILDQVLDEQ